MSARRGQTLVLFAVTVILLTAGVLVTLALGARIKERMELQTLADAAAYDNAVVAARTFNSLSVTNRAEWSLLVAQSAAQAYLSWGTLYRSAIESAEAAVPGACTGARASLTAEKARMLRVWGPLEPEAHDELKRLSRVQGQLLRENSQRDYALLEKLVGNDEVTRVVLQNAQSTELERETPRRANLRQISRDCQTGVACDLNSRGFLSNRTNWTILRHQHEVFMGTRGDPFTTGRFDRRQVLAKAVSGALGPGARVRLTSEGSSYRSRTLWTHGDDFATGPGNAQYPRLTPSSLFSDDHGVLQFQLPACGVRADLNLAVLLKEGAIGRENQHTWSVSGVVNSCDNPNHALDNLGLRQAWPLVIDFNDKKARDQNHFFGQSTLKVQLARDYGARRADPWDRLVTLDDGELTVSVDDQGLDLRPSAPSRSHQAAVSTSIAYYHRRGAWAEPPNFLNPFWQATLISTRWVTP